MKFSTEIYRSKYNDKWKWKIKFIDCTDYKYIEEKLLCFDAPTKCYDPPTYNTIDEECSIESFSNTIEVTELDLDRILSIIKQIIRSKKQKGDEVRTRKRILEWDD